MCFGYYCKDVGLVAILNLRSFSFDILSFFYCAYIKCFVKNGISQFVVYEEGSFETNKMKINSQK